MYQAVLHATIPNDAPEELGNIIVDYVFAQARVNYRQIVKSNLPGLYDAGVRWERTRPYVASQCDGEVCERPEQADLWRDVTRVYKDGVGDCKDLVAIRLAERWLLGDMDAQPVTIRYPEALGPGYDLFHVILVHGDGTEEDPSSLLGMKEVG